MSSFAGYYSICKKWVYSFDTWCFAYSKMIFISNCFENSEKLKYCSSIYLMTNKPCSKMKRKRKSIIKSHYIGSQMKYSWPFMILLLFIIPWNILVNKVRLIRKMKFINVKKTNQERKFDYLQKIRVDLTIKIWIKSEKNSPLKKC